MRILITGATGTLGRRVIKKILAKDDEINIVGISRDEQKQRTMPKHDRLLMRLADIRSRESLFTAVGGYDFDVVAHFAALKCVDTLEANPMEAVRTNVDGTKNVIDLARQGFMRAKLVLASTDKAVFPINTYGYTKALAEKLILEDSWGVVCRYGNVLGSRGSVVPAFINSLLKHQTINITHPEMTRFWLTVDQAADLVIRHIFSAASTGGTAIPSIKASKVLDVGVAIAELLGVSEYQVNEIGIRPGEKMHETLELGVSSDTCEQFTPGELKDLLGPLVTEVVGKC